jgi:hypothetical protein
MGQPLNRRRTAREAEGSRSDVFGARLVSKRCCQIRGFLASRALGLARRHHTKALHFLRFNGYYKQKARRTRMYRDAGVVRFSKGLRPGRYPPSSKTLLVYLSSYPPTGFAERGTQFCVPIECGLSAFRTVLRLRLGVPGSLHSQLAVVALPLVGT